MMGMIEVNGKKYVKRQRIYKASLTVSSGLSVTLNQSVVLPGIADFLLEARTRVVIASGAVASNPFTYREGNSDGGVYYMAGGVGASNDRVVDSLCFGNGMFPFPVVPGIFFTKNASILFDVEDLSNVVPYTIHFAWIGSDLIPAV